MSDRLLGQGQLEFGKGLAGTSERTWELQRFSGPRLGQELIGAAGYPGTL